MPFLSGVLPTGAQYSSGRSWGTSRSADLLLLGSEGNDRRSGRRRTRAGSPEDSVLGIPSFRYREYPLSPPQFTQAGITNFPEEEGILHYSHHGAGYHKPCQTNLIQLALWLGGWGEGNERNPQLSTTSTPTTRECALLPGVLWFKEVRPTLSLHVADRAARACLLPEELAGPLHESNS